MGLDWIPMPKPKAGREKAFVSLCVKLYGPRLLQKKRFLDYVVRAKELKEPSESEADLLVQKLDEVSDPAFVLLDAPRVGYDEVANQWVRGRVLEREGSLDGYEATLEDMRGYHVLELLPPCDGFPFYTHAGAYAHVDRCSFRGSFLHDVEDILGSELIEQAYRCMLPDTLKAYGLALQGKARAFADAHDLWYIEKCDSADLEEGSVDQHADILFSAAKWCIYWAERGHGMESWF